MTKNVWITIKKELKRIIRDKKSLVMMLITPLTIPLFIICFSYIYQDMATKEEKTTYNVGINYKLSEQETNIIKSIDFNTINYNNEEEMKDAYEQDKISAYIIKDNNNYKLYFNSMNIDSAYAGRLARSYLENYNTYLGQVYLESIEANLDNVYNNINYSVEELSGSNSMANEVLIMGLVFAVMAISLTAIYSSTDAVAGEKERGTLETILTFPIKSTELITGKFMSIFIACLITSIVSLLLLVISFKYSINTFDIYKTMTIEMTPINILLSLIILIGYGIFISGLCIVIASFAKTYKEAQSLLTPINMITIVPMFMDLFELKLNHIIACIPIINHTMLIEAIFYGKAEIIDIIIMFITTVIYSIILILLISKQYKKEEILFSN